MIDTILGHMYQADTNMALVSRNNRDGLRILSYHSFLSLNRVFSPGTCSKTPLSSSTIMDTRRTPSFLVNMTVQCPPPRGRRRRTNSHVLKNRRSLTNDTFPSTNSLLTVKLSRYLLLLLLALTNLSSCNINYQLPSLWTGKWFWWRRSLSGPGQRQHEQLAVLQLVTAAGNDPIRSPWLLSLFSFPGSQELYCLYSGS